MLKLKENKGKMEIQKQEGEKEMKLKEDREKCVGEGNEMCEVEEGTEGVG